MMILFLWFCLPALISGHCIGPDENVRIDPNSLANLYKGQQHFSLNILKIYNELYKERNIFFSPHSMYQALLLAYVTSANETEAIIQKALRLPETQNKIMTIQNFGLEKYIQNMRKANGSSDYEFTSCNKIFVSDKVKTRECVANLLKDEIDTLNFEHAESARSYINNWVENITQNHIKELLPHDSVHENTKMILANAAYFKGLWKSRFPPENTKKNSLFYVSPNDIKIVDYMAQKGSFNHVSSEKLKAHILEMPYKGEEISMVVLLPRFENNAVDNLINQLSQESLQEVINFEDSYPRQVEVEMPKFTVEQTANLRPVFEKLGLSKIFNESADFSTLTEGSSIPFSDAIHKAKVEVDEEGTVAAASTAIFTFRSSRPLEPTKFVANHPFIYLIYDKTSRNILFMGVYRVPDKKYRNGKRISA